jgi:elongation factor G
MLFKKPTHKYSNRYYKVEVLSPEELTGAVMGDIQSRRGMVEGIDAEGHFQKIIAKVPLAEMHGFSSSLRSITQGRAKFRMAFDSYQPMSFEQQRKLAEEYKASTTEMVA